MTDKITSDPGICAQCAAQGPTCCHLAPGDEEYCFPVSETEMRRIHEHAPATGGFVLENNSKAFVDNVCRLFSGEEDIVQTLFPEQQSHYRLALTPDGTCRFLGSSGCTIPRQLRPYYCRVYPFWVVGSEVICFDSKSCLARKGAASINQMLRRVNVSKPEIRDLYGRLRLAWGLPPQRGMCAVKKGF